MTNLEPGQMAPAFSGIDQAGVVHSLSDYQGQWLLLYFYPKADTPGCTTEACSFRDNFAKLQQKDIRILGVSGDTQSAQKKFAEKYTLPFPLLADTQKKVIALYGADGVLFPKRISVLIRPDGSIAKMYPKVDVQKHAQQVLEDFAALQ